MLSLGNLTEAGLCHLGLTWFPCILRKLKEGAFQQEEAAKKLKSSEQRLLELEAESEELFSKATAAEEEVDVVTGNLAAVKAELGTTQQQLAEAQRKMEELTQADAEARFKVSSICHAIYLSARTCRILSHIERRRK